MTAPDFGTPPQSLAVGLFAERQATTEEEAKAGMKGGPVDSFSDAQGTAHGTYNNVIDDHTQQLADLTSAVEQIILQGNALRFDDNDTFTPNENIVALEAIIIGAGGGGSSGSYDALVDGTRSGGGGGGGGETHVLVPASLLPTNGDGTYKAIQIIIGAGGAGAPSDAGFGTGGGHTYLGPEVGSVDPAWLLGGGGQGGVWGNSGTIAQGGSGMVPGGNGDRGLGPAGAGPGPGTSTSAFSLNGGGGGGGRGAAQGRGGGTAGGSGAIFPGGAPGSPGNAGTPPSSIVATGGGGGGGGSTGTAGGGNGANPAGGGGGSACSSGGATFGGNGGNGVMFIIERMS